MVNQKQKIFKVFIYTPTTPSTWGAKKCMSAGGFTLNCEICVHSYSSRRQRTENNWNLIPLSKALF